MGSVAEIFSIPGPAVTPLAALARVAHAPVIALLHGSEGACLVWYDEPLPTGISSLGDLPGGLTRDPQDFRTSGLPDFRTLPGYSWGTIPPQSFLIQCDYETPTAPPLIIPAAHVVRWDATGRCTIHGVDPARETHRFIAETLARDVVEPPPIALAAPIVPAWDAAGHARRIARIHDYIAAGDCYQVNLAVPFRARFAPAPHRDVAAFLALMRASPAPFAGFFRHPGRPSVVSHSPECLLAARGDQLVSVPIKGTRRRDGRDVEALWQELLASTKDAAELAMITDLVRNDLGRVAVPGSVAVADQAVRMDLSYVIHRAARITARLHPQATLVDALLASFPAGSITGAPKRRVMDIISELEGRPRGAYCGTFGWLGPGGMDLAVAIRTASVSGDAVSWHAGGGIVWDSRADAEWDEVRAKASAMAAAWGGVL